MKTPILKWFLFVMLLSLYACGGGSNGGNGDPSAVAPPGDTPDPGGDASELEIVGKLPYLATDGELKLVVGDKTFAGEILPDGDYRVSAPINVFQGAGLVRVEAAADQARMIIPLVDAGRLPELAGSDRELASSELAKVDFSEFAAASYAVLVSANDGTHIATENELVNAQRDHLNGDIALQLASALRLNLRDGHSLPAGIDDTWQLMLDHAAAARFLDDVRASELVSAPSRALKGLGLASDGDIVSDTIDEIVSETGADAVYTPIPEGSFMYLRVTTISRDLGDHAGFFARLESDGTGYVYNAGGTDEVAWVIDANGRIVITPANGLPVTIQGIDEDGIPFERTRLTQQMTLTRLQENRRDEVRLNDLLYVESVTRERYDDPAHEHLNDGIEPVTTARSMIALRTPGLLSWEEDEPVGVWALPGVMFSDNQVNIPDMPVKSDDIYEFRIDEEGVGRGVTLLSGEGFTWQPRIGVDGRIVGIDLNWYENGDGVVYNKVREDGGAFDMAMAAAVSVGEGEELVKYANGSLGFKRDGSFVFEEANAAASYLLYGAVEPLAGDLGRFMMFVQPDHHVTFEVLDENGAPVPHEVRRWDADEEGRLVVSHRRDVTLANGVPTPGADNPDCVDPDACYTAHERIEHPMKLDGDILYVLEEQKRYAFDPSKPFGKGEIVAHQKHIRYWEIGALPDE